MAYPVVQSTASTEVTTDGTSHSITMPSGIAAGDLLLAFVTCDGDTTFTHTGWRKLRDVTAASGGVTLCRHLLLARRAAGSDTLTVGTAASESLSAVVYRISGASGQVELESARTSTADTAPNGPSLTPSWGSADTLWIASTGWDDGTSTISAYPSGWSSNQVEASANNAGSTGTAVCTLTSTNTSENPAAWTLSAAEAHADFTVGVRPALTTGVASVGNGAIGADSTAGGTANPPLPPDWKVGDFAVLFLGARYQTSHLPNEPSVSAGWTKRGTYAVYDMGAGSNSPFLFIYTRFLQSGDTAPTVTNVNDASLPNEATYSVIACFTGVDTTTPIDVTPVGSNAVAATTWTPTGLTTNTNNAMVVSAVSMSDDNTVALASGSAQGFGLQFWQESTVGNDMTVAAAVKTVPTAGSVTCPTWEQTARGPDNWAGMTFALKPATSSAQQVDPAGVADGAAFGTPTVTPGAVTVSPSGLADAAVFGTPSVGSPAVVAATASSAATSEYRNDWSVSLPSGISAGDLLLVWASSTGSDVTKRFETPSGWTEVGYQLHTSGYPRTVQLFAKEAAGSEGSSLTFYFPTGNFQGYSSVSLRVTGWSGDVNDLELSSFQTGSGSSIDAPSLTSGVAQASRLVLRLLGGCDRSSWTPPSGVTLKANVVSDATHNCESRAYTDDDGSVGAETFSNSGSPSGPLIGLTVVVPPAVPTVTVSPVGLSDGQSFGSPAVTVGAVTVSPSGLSDPAVVGTPTITTGAVSVSPSGVAATAAVGAATATPGTVTVSPTGVASAAAVGAPSASVGPATVSPAGLAPTAEVGAPSFIAGAVTVAPAGLTDPPVFGAPTVTRQDLTFPQGVGVSARFGRPVVQRSSGSHTPLALRVRHSHQRRLRPTPRRR